MARANYGGHRGRDELAVTLWHDSDGLLNSPVYDHLVADSVYIPLRARHRWGKDPLVRRSSRGLPALCDALRSVWRPAGEVARPTSGH